MRTSVALAADASASAGLGHLARSSALACALSARGVAVRCHALGAGGPITFDDVVWEPCRDLESIAAAAPAALVLDSYAVGADAAAEVVRAPVVVFYDGRAAPTRAALIIASGPPPEPMDPARGSAEVLTGLAHAPLRRAFWGLPRRIPREPVARVLVTTGGGDVANAAAQWAAAAGLALPGATVALVRGPHARSAPPAGVELVEGARSLLGELQRADLVVSAAGQTALEAAAVGVPTIALPLVANQRGNAAALAQARAALVVDPAEGELCDRVAALAADHLERCALSARAQERVDGYGALRIAYAVERLAARRG